MTESTTRGQKAAQIFGDALELSPEDRAPFVTGQCGDDPALQDQVMALLSEHDGADRFFADLMDRAERDLEGTAAESSLEGRRIGVYRILELIGQGGMGTVYLAERADGQYEQRVALKLLPIGLLQVSELKQRFLAERQLLALVTHRNVAALLDGGIADDGTPYFVMEYVEGTPITAYCDDHRLNIADRLTKFRELCAGVQHAHQHLIIHRDIKPSNTLVTPTGDVKLLDFGIAKLLESQDTVRESLTSAMGGIPFTPSHASPEQLRGDLTSTATDVYSLGVLLYELLAGVLPFDRTEPDLAKHAATFEPPPLSASLRSGYKPATNIDADMVAAKRGLNARSLRRILDSDLNTIVTKALAIEPQRRYTSVEALSADIKNYLSERPVAARPPTRRYRIAKFARRNAAGVAVAAIFLVLVGAMTFMGLRFAVAIAAERDAAERALELTSKVIALDDPAIAQGERRALLAEYANDATQQLASHPRQLAKVLGALGANYKSLGMNEQAEKTLRDALNAAQRAAGPTNSNARPDNQELLEIMGNLGDSLVAQGRYDEAEPLLARAHELAIELHGERSGDTLNVLNSISELYNQSRRYEEGEKHALEAVAIADALPDSDYRVKAIAYNNLAVIYYVTKPPIEVVKTLERALDTLRGGLPDSHPELWRIKANLAGALLQIKQVDRAAALYSEVIAASKEQQMPNHFAVGQATYGLGLLEMNRGHFRDALQLLRTSQRITLSEKPESDYEAILHNFQIAQALQAGGNTADAENESKIGLALANEHLPANIPLTARILFQMANLELARGDHESAEEHIKQGFEIFGALHDVKPRYKAEGDLARGYLLLANRQYGEAEPLLAEALRILETENGTHSPQSRAATQALIRLYTETGRSAVAQQYHARLASDGE